MKYCCKDMKDFIRALSTIVKQKEKAIMKDIAEDPNHNYCQYCGEELKHGDEDLCPDKGR